MNQPNSADTAMGLDPSGSANNNAPGCNSSRSRTCARLPSSSTTASATSLGGTASRNNNSNSHANSNDNAIDVPETETESHSQSQKPEQQTPEQGSVNSAPWLPPETGTGTKRIVWKPKHRRPKHDRDRDEIDDQYEVEQGYKDKESGNTQDVAGLSNVVVVSGAGARDDPDFRMGKEPLDKPGKTTRQEETGRGEPPPIPHVFIQFVNCNCHTFEVSPNLHIREFRTKFLAKVMLVKSVQWTFLLACILTMRMFPQMEALFIKTPEVGYIFIMTYITTITATRACEFGRKTWGALLTLDIETICLVYTGGQLLFSTEEYMLPATVITITMTNLSLAILFYVSKADVSENSPLYGTSTSLVLAMSVASMFAATTLYPPPKTESWLKKLCAMSFFNFLISETYVMMEVSDINFILRGYRFPVSEDDWLPVAASLF